MKETSSKQGHRRVIPFYEMLEKVTLSYSLVGHLVLPKTSTETFGSHPEGPCHWVVQPKLLAVTFRYKKNENRSCKSSQGLASLIPENRYHFILLGKESHKAIPDSRAGDADCCSMVRVPFLGKHGKNSWGTPWPTTTTLCYSFLPHIINNFIQGPSTPKVWATKQWLICLCIHSDNNYQESMFQAHQDSARSMMPLSNHRKRGSHLTGF